MCVVCLALVVENTFTAHEEPVTRLRQRRRELLVGVAAAVAANVCVCMCMCVNGSATERVSRSRMRCRRSWELCPGPVLLRSSLQQDHKIHMKRTIHMLRLLLLGNMLQGEFLPVALGGILVN